LRAIRALADANQVHACAHITGGGLPGNLHRVMPEGCHAAVNYDAWTRPPLVSLIQDRGDVPEDDLRRTFNLGIGLVAVVPEAAADAACATLSALGESPLRIGVVRDTD
jgi:phosphoribosylformylglycinamidine cyclo-ligase